MTTRINDPMRVVWMLALGLAIAAQGRASDFRGHAWGASPEEVKALERHDLHHDIDGELAYWNFQFAGVEAGLVYTFEDGRLVRAHFLSRNPTTDPEEDLADYRAFQALLTEHHGEPVAEEWVWLDGDERAASEGTLADIVAGRARLETRWELETADATLLIAGGDGAIQTVWVVYEPPAR